MIDDQDIRQNVKVDIENSTWTVNIKKIQTSGNKTINLIWEDSQGKSINQKIAVNVNNSSENPATKTQELICMAGVNGDDLNLFLLGDDIAKNNQVKAYMFAGTSLKPYQSPPVKIETLDLLKYQNFDGTKKPDDKSTYKIVAGFNLTQEKALQTAKNTDEKSCQQKSTGNPCIVCIKPKPPTKVPK